MWSAIRPGSSPIKGLAAGQPHDQSLQRLRRGDRHHLPPSSAAAFVASSTSITDRMPSVEQTVSSITVKDGRGGSWTNTYATRAANTVLPSAASSALRPKRKCISGIHSASPLGTTSRAQPSRARSASPLPRSARSPPRRFATAWRSAEADRPHLHIERHNAALTPRCRPRWRYFIGRRPAPRTRRTGSPHRACFSTTPSPMSCREGITAATDVTGDERANYTDFAPKSRRYIVSHPGHGARPMPALTSSGTLTSRGGDILRRAPVLYAPPTKGDDHAADLDQIHAALGAVETFDYGTVGNLPKRSIRKEPRPTGATTPPSPLSDQGDERAQSVDLDQLDFPCGQPATETDLNGIVTDYTYDVLLPQTARSAGTGAIRGVRVPNFLEIPTVSRSWSRGARIRIPAPSNKTANFDGLGRI